MNRYQVREGHLTTAEMGPAMEWARREKVIVSDECAVTIAAWWQSSGTWAGSVLAAFASGCEVSQDDLLNAVDVEISESHPDSEDSHAYLGALREWAATAPCVTCGKRPQAGGMFEAECVGCYLGE